MHLPFVKMHGLGNDFMVIESLSQTLPDLTPDTIRLWSDRHTGVGFDQLMVLDPPSHKDIDFDYRIYNTDGSQVQQCGNGARCLVAFIHKQRLSPKRSLLLQSTGGISQADILSEHNTDLAQLDIRLYLPAPDFEPTSLPVISDSSGPIHTLCLPDINISVSGIGLSVGNPHLVLWAEDFDQPLDTLDIQSIGYQLNNHTMLPEGINVEWVEIIDPQTIKIRVYERGAGETLACGTGACAAVVASHHFKQCALKQTVHLKGGRLHIELFNDPPRIGLTGAATTVYQGQLLI